MHTKRKDTSIDTSLEAPLPKSVYFKHGKYYLVRQNKWHMLGADRKKLHEQILAVAPDYKHIPEDLESYLRRKAAMLKCRPESRTGRLKEVTITVDHTVALAAANQWRCEISGIKMSLDKINGGRPYAPSIDRIDSSGDYHPGNVRIVCIAVNLAMNVWGEEVLERIAASMRHSKRVLSK